MLQWPLLWLRPNNALVAVMQTLGMETSKSCGSKDADGDYFPSNNTLVQCATVILCAVMYSVMSNDVLLNARGPNHTLIILIILVSF